MPQGVYKHKSGVYKHSELTKQKIGLSNSVSNKGKHCSPKTEFKKGRVSDEKHPGWKGDGVKYSGLHMWIRRKLGTPNICEHCRKTSLPKNQYQWANKSQKYKRDLKDWIRLCAKCHRKYDNIPDRLRRIKVLSLRNLKNKLTKF